MIGGLYAWGAIGAAAVAAAGVIWWQAGTIADLRTDLDQCRAAASTLERINDAISGPRSPSDILERLRDLAQ